jgi:hypothetical protein
MVDVACGDERHAMPAWRYSCDASISVWHTILGVVFIPTRRRDLNGQMSNEPLGALLAVIGKSRNLILIGRGAKFIATQKAC